MNLMDHDNIGKDSEGRRRIMQAAYPLFVEQGYKAVSMQQIADAAQIHKATLYHHFLHKEDLFGSVVVMAMLQSREEVADVIRRGGTAEEQLVGAALQLFARAQSDLGRLMTDIHENIEPERRNKLLKEKSMPWELFEQIFADAIGREELPPIDPGFGVSLFIGMVWGQIWMQKMDWRTNPLDAAMAKSIVQVLFAGLRGARTETGAELLLSN
jgi:AcrR family transcriptional regulator